MSLECACVHYSNGKCKKLTDDKHTAWCVAEGLCDYREPSNADHIRGMSDEDLAWFIAERFANDSILRIAGQGLRVSDEAKNAIKNGLYGTWIKYLKQPAEGV